MTNIIYLAPYFWPEEIGSAPYCSELAFHLAKRGHNVRAVAFRPHYPSTEPFAAWATGARDAEIEAGVRIQRVRVNERGSAGLKDRLRNDIRFLRHVVWSAATQKFRGTDIIVAYVPSVMTLFGAKAVRLFTGAPIVAIVHDIESGLASSLGIAKGGTLLRLMRLVERIGLNFARSVVVLTEGMAEELHNIGCRAPLKVISIWGNVVSESAIDPAARPVLMYSGNFGKKQNLDQLVPLLAKLSAEAKAVDVVMRGDGSEKQRIAVEIKRRRIQNVTFLPLVPAAELNASLQGANVHLVPQAETVVNYALPSKLFSIMAAGRPFICIANSDSPLDKLTAKSQAGLCVRQGDEKALYEAVVSLLENPDLQQRLGRNGQRFIRDNMDRQKILCEFEALITS